MVTDLPDRPALASLPPAEALAYFASSWTGLTRDQVKQRHRRFGANTVVERTRHDTAKHFVSQFTHFFALALWACAGLAFLGALPELGWAIVIVIAVNGLFSFAQEYRAERSTRALAALLPPMASVRRDGRATLVAAEELVPGDILLIEEGVRISADARVLSADALRVDNSALTGESEPVSRSAGGSPAVADALECPNLLLAGSWAVSGRAVAVVVATGSATRFGSLARLTAGVQRRATPLHAKLNRAVRILSAVALGAGLLFLSISVVSGMPVHNALLFAVGVIVALVPEGLLPTLTLALALGATRMARRGALVRRLEAVETLGSTTVICTDKTGTLTENQMTVTRAWTPLGTLRASGTGYLPDGAILKNDRPISSAERVALEPLFQSAALCSDARLEVREGRWSCLGDPTDGALLVFVHKGGASREELAERTTRVALFPFDAERRRMTTIHLLPDGERLVSTKGSPELILPLCSSLRAAGVGRALTAADRGEIARALDRLATEGLRVLAVARKLLRSGEPSSLEVAESDLELLGLVGMWDPIRPSVPEAIRKCRGAGIRVLMVTGDHPATAAAIGRHIGLTGAVRLGRDLPSDEAALTQLLAGGVAILARVAPEQKRAIARALQRGGEVVAMTGDGVNDAPALRQADIGVAMGASGTDVAREAADLVLLDDDFSHIVEAVEEGRAAFSNIQRFLTYHLTDNVAELAPFVCWALSGGSFPLVLSVLQLLAIDIGTDLLPALALGAERPSPHHMAEPPRSRAAPLLDRSVLLRAFAFLGPLEAIVVLALVPLASLLFLGWQPGDALPASPPASSRLSTLVFASIVLMQVANALECRSKRASLFSRAMRTNRLLLLAIGTELFVLLACVYVPALQGLLGHYPLGSGEWALAAITPLLLFSAEELRKLVIRVRSRPDAALPGAKLRATTTCGRAGHTSD